MYHDYTKKEALELMQLVRLRPDKCILELLEDYGKVRENPAAKYNFGGQEGDLDLDE